MRTPNPDPGKEVPARLMMLAEFSPDEVFMTMLKKPMDKLGHLCRLPDLSAAVRRHLRDAMSSRSDQHLATLRTSGIDMTAVQVTCGICLVSPKVNVLRCQHGFCDTCVRENAEQTVTSYWSLSCPICQQQDTVELKPEGSSVRALIMCVNDAMASLRFLKRLRDRLFGNLTDYFDIVVGMGEGTCSNLQRSSAG